MRPRWEGVGPYRRPEATCRRCGGINALHLVDGDFEHRDPAMCELLLSVSIPDYWPYDF